jgi:hypothetical protein
MGKNKAKKKLKALQKKQGEAAEAQMDGIPQSMVFRRGKVGQHVAELVEDMRHVMSPYTAKNLKEVRRTGHIRLAALRSSICHVQPDD